MMSYFRLQCHTPRRFCLFLLAVTSIVALAGASLAADSQTIGAPDSKREGLSIEAPGPFTMTAPISMRLAMENSSATPMTLPSLDSGFVKIILKQKPAGSTWSATHGGGIRAITRRLSSGELTQWESTVQPKVTLAPGAVTDWAFDLLKDFGIRLHPGDYIMSVAYEEFFAAEAHFSVGVDNTRTVPDLIDLIEKGDATSRVWARNSLFILTGKPEWDMETPAMPAILAERIQELRRWWAAGRTRITLKTDNFLSQ